MKSLILLALALPLAAQSTYPKHNFSLGVGAGLPGGELTGLFRNSAGITFNYGYDLEDYRDHPCHCGTPQCVGYIVAEEYFASVRKPDSA